MTDTSDFNDFNTKVIDEFRANDGNVSGMFEGAPMVLITHTGAKSGAQRTNPLVYSTDGDKVVLIASMGGAPNNPAWYHNLVANPEVNVELGTNKYKARAREAKGAERDRLFAKQAEQMPQFAEYQEKTDRVIPVFVLEPID